MSAPIVVSVSFKDERKKGAPALNGRSFSFSVTPEALASLAARQVSVMLNGLVQGTPTRPAMSVDAAEAAIIRMLAGGKLAKNTEKARKLSALLARPTAFLNDYAELCTDKRVLQDIHDEISRRGEAPSFDRPTINKRKGSED